MTADGSSSSMLLLIALLAAAAGADAALRRIPNVLPTSVAAVGLLHVVTTHGLVDALAHLLVAVLVGAVLAVLWRRGIVGGGDVKLAAACASWLGPGSLATFLVATALAGGAMAVVTALASLARARSAAGPAAALTIREQIRRATVPYGAAIAAGAVLAASR